MHTCEHGTCLSLGGHVQAYTLDLQHMYGGVMPNVSRNIYKAETNLQTCTNTPSI